MVIIEIKPPLQNEAHGSRRRGAGSVEPWHRVRARLLGAMSFRQGDPAAVLGLSCPASEQARQVSYEYLLLIPDHGDAVPCAEGL